MFLQAARFPLLLFKRSISLPFGPFTSVRMASAKTKRDPCTNANYDQWLSRHITANLAIDFPNKRLSGSVDLIFESINPSSEIILDTSYLDIQGVKVNGESLAKWELAPRCEPYGSPLKIQVDGNATPGTNLSVTIDIQTTPECTAIQWLEPEQTSNKKYPYVFAQCQAIHGRSVFPCQDTPDVKSTIDFNIRSSLPVITSGLQTGTRDYLPGDGGRGSLLYTSKQEIPIPSYLFSIASGDIATAAIGPRSLVATGPEELTACKWEFERDMEPFLQAAEKILGGVPYIWTTYNILVLPASFPYGGMETPVFTLATPTLISGDRENVNVIAHELAHSWSGNLVSNANWQHFWLNEGWTVYLERRIQAEIDGEPQRGFHGLIGWKDLTEAVSLFGKDHPYTRLVIEFKDVDPDDAYSAIAYEKGFIFLYHLENLLGKDKFDTFIPHYFQTWTQKSLDSDEFKATILDFFKHDDEASKKLNELDWDGWYYTPGLPPKPDFDTQLVDVCYKLADKWESRAKGDTGFKPSADDIKGWVANQSVVFLDRVMEFDPPISVEDSKHIGQLYGYVNSKNVEVVSRYLRLALSRGDKAAVEPTSNLLGQVGRMKFVRPLYRALAKVDRKSAESTFKKNETFYHPICRQMAKQDLYGKK